MSKKLIVAIDGPSGAGKSTLSKLLAKRLNYLNIDTGAMYRSVAWAAQQQGIASDDDEALGAMVETLEIGFKTSDDGEQVIVNGENVSRAIRTPEISLLTAEVAASPAVRTALVQLQRRLGEGGGVVLEGRDIGTVVFPQAEIKFFLSATAQERGRRRYEELIASGVEADLEKTIAEVEERDAADTAREHSPLVRAADAVDIDSTSMSISEVLEEMVATVKAREVV